MPNIKENGYYYGKVISCALSEDQRGNPELYFLFEVTHKWSNSNTAMLPMSEVLHARLWDLLCDKQNNLMAWKVERLSDAFPHIDPSDYRSVLNDQGYVDKEIVIKVEMKQNNKGDLNPEIVALIDAKIDDPTQATNSKRYEPKRVDINKFSSFSGKFMAQFAGGQSSNDKKDVPF